jgi:hypothetical protein
MTAEEYLNQHCKPEDWYNVEESLKDFILTNNVIEYMEQYAALRINDVVGRSEQLIDFAIKEGYFEGVPKGNLMGLIDRFENQLISANSRTDTTP